jgi:hypothetical protein
MNKHAILALIIEKLQQEAESLAKGAHTAHSDATNPESKAEHKYDTRGLEASYLAGAQAKIAAEALQNFSFYQTMELQNFPDDTPIAISALIELESETGAHSFYFLGMKGGGVDVEYEGHTILLITPASPIGRNLIGKTTGDSVTIMTGNGKKEYEIVSVC